MVDFFATHQVAVDGEEFVEDVYDAKKTGEAYRSSFLTYAHWLKLKKAGGSPIETHIRRINISRAYYEALETEGKVELVHHLDQLKVVPSSDSPSSQRLEESIGEGIIPRFGFALRSLRLVEWVPHKSTEEMAQALLTREKERHLAKGVREKAAGERDAFEARGTGESTRYDRFLEVMTNRKVDPNVAADVLRTQVEMENLRGAGVSTYIRGQAQAGVMVPTQSPAPLSPVKVNP